MGLFSGELSKFKYFEEKLTGKEKKNIRKPENQKIKK